MLANLSRFGADAGTSASTGVTIGLEDADMVHSMIRCNVGKEETIDSTDGCYCTTGVKVSLVEGRWEIVDIFLVPSWCSEFVIESIFCPFSCMAGSTVVRDNQSAGHLYSEDTFSYENVRKLVVLLLDWNTGRTCSRWV